MAKPTFFDYPAFKPTKIPAIRIAHWKPATAYTRWRWIVQATIVLAFVAVPYLRWLKLDFANGQYWLLGHEVSMVIALQAVVVLWVGSYFINFFENYLVGRLLCGWICPWGLLNRLGMAIHHLLRRHPRRRLVLILANLAFAAAATLVVMNWMIDLGTLVKPQHIYFGWAWCGLVSPFYTRWDSPFAKRSVRLACTSPWSRRKIHCAWCLTPGELVWIAVCARRSVPWIYRPVRWISKIP